MLKGLIFKIVVFFVLTILIINRGYSQSEVLSPVRIMFYNTENLFDINDDTLKADNDFLPEGVLRWNFTRYRAKINSLYKTIVAAGEWEPPIIVALCEVENRAVLEDLVYRTYLSKYNYGIVHEDSPDTRGIDVCLIYRKRLVDIIDYSYWIPTDISRSNFTSRSVLYLKIKINTDTVHFIVNHWPSRRGGVLASEELRIKIARMVRMKVDSIMMNSKCGAKIIITGDFNCTPEDQEMKLLVAFKESDCLLINLSEKLTEVGAGTYRYHGIWEMIDQVIVSDALIKGNQGLVTDVMNLVVFRPDFLMIKDPKFPGFSPFSTYRGYRYLGGYSDHLPVLLDLNVR